MTVKKLARIGTLVTVLTLAAGCQGGLSDGDSKISFDAIGGNASEPLQYKGITATPSQSQTKFALSPSQGALENTSVDSIAVKVPSMQAYIQGIADKLLRHWSGDRPEKIGVFVSADRRFDARATSGNDVFLSWKVIEDLETEDALAAIIAHELGHILLRHFQDSKAAKEIVQVGQVAAAASATAAIISNMESRKVGDKREFYIPVGKQAEVQGNLGDTVGILVAGITLVSDVGLSAYDRHQELEADAFAIEMLHQAGYNPTAINDVLEELRKADVQQEKEKKQYRLTAQSLEGMITQAIGNLLTDIAEKIKKTHPDPKRRLQKAGKKLDLVVGYTNPPEKRSAQLNAAKAKRDYKQFSNFYKKLYDAADASASSTDRRALSRLMNQPYGRSALSRTIAYPVIMSYDADQAYRFLKSARGRNTAPANYYVYLSMAYAERGEAAAAKSTIAEMAGRMGWQSTYPAAIRTANTLADEAWKAQLLAGCEATGSKPAKKLCRNAAKGRNANEEFRPIAGLAGILVGAREDSATSKSLGSSNGTNQQSDDSSQDNQSMAKSLVNSIVGSIFKK